MSRQTILPVLLAGILLAGAGCAGRRPPAAAEAPTRPAAPSAFIVQGESAEAARQLVERVGGEVTHELAIIRAVGALLTADQRAELERMEGVVRIHVDRQVGASGR